MPYQIKKQGRRWLIVRKADGKVVGRSYSRAKAEASVRARYAGERKKGG